MSNHDLERLVQQKDLKGVALAIRAGADPNFAGRLGWTPLHSAASVDSAEIVQLLVTSSARVDAGDFHGITPLAIAVGGDSFTAAKALIALGARVDLQIPGYRYGTVLHLACAWGQTAMAKLLFTAWPDAQSIRDHDGMTPMDFAKEAEADEIVRLLE